MPDQNHPTTRRKFLQLTAALTGGLALSLHAQDRSVPRSAALNADKFNPDGSVRAFAGNTVICHLDQQGANSVAFDALLDIYRQVQTHAFARKMALLPPSSYHMTVFGGANDRDRRRDTWPADLALDLPIDECNKILGQRLRASGAYDVAPIRMRVDTDEPPPNDTVFRIRLKPFDASEEKKLRELRERLATAFGMRRTDHEKYIFHISIAYLLDRLAGDEAADFRRSLARWREQLAQRCPSIDLGAPEYCTFKDMYAFHREFYLRP